MPTAIPAGIILPTSSLIKRDGDFILKDFFIVVATLLAMSLAVDITCPLPALSPELSPDIAFAPMFLNCPGVLENGLTNVLDKVLIKLEIVRASCREVLKKAGKA